MPSKKIVINHPYNWTETDLSESVKTFYFEVDEDNNVKATPVLIFDPTFNPTAIGEHIKAIDNNSSTVKNIGSSFIGLDIFPNGTVAWALLTKSEIQLVNKATGYDEAQRTPSVFKQVSGVTTGDNTVWDPGATKKVRLMGGIMGLSKDAACAGALVLQLVETGVSTILSFDISGAALVATGNEIVIPFNFPGNGYLFTSVATILALRFNAALTAGKGWCVAWGTEE